MSQRRRSRRHSSSTATAATSSRRRFFRSRPARLPAPALLLVLLLSRSTLAAFASQAVQVRGGTKPSRTLPSSSLGAKKDPIKKAVVVATPRRFRPFSNAAAAMASSLRKRKSAAEEAAKSSMLLARSGSDPGEDDTNKEAKIALEAANSIRRCSQMALAAFVSDIFVTLMEREVLFRRAFAWTYLVDLADSLNLLVFSLGLRRVSSIYAKTFETGREMCPEIAVDLCSTLAGLWRNTAVVLVLLSMSQSTSLAEFIPFPRDVSGSYALPTVVAAAALTGRIVLGNKCADDAAAAVQNEGNSPIVNGYERSRTMGFVASRNAQFCAGSFGLMAAVQLTAWLLKPSDLVGRVFSVFDFITPAAIAGLLLALYRGFLRAVVNSTAGKTLNNKKKGDAADGQYAEYADLFEAQRGFYTKAAETLKSQAVFAVLPYAFAVVKPYGLAAFHLVAGKLGLAKLA